ncbi:cell wall-binding repeat-containing protein [Kineococcus gypseus]|uniref:cell wall-binding repeat-containing protein n=1 Tax=Kineococcus gypseus TaxID=1637102 RepID=UPI003D7D76D4
MRVRTRPALACAALALLAGPWGSAPAAAQVLPPSVVQRFGGADRYATSALVAAEFAPADVERVFLASGEVFPDGLAAGAAAARFGAPLLLTRAGALPAAVEAELVRLSPPAVHVVGGPVRVGERVLERVRELLPDALVTRTAGEDRYATAALLAEQFFPDPVEVAVLVRGDAFPDALPGAALAAAAGGPLLLTEPDRLPGRTTTWLRAEPLSRLVVLGGTGAVGEAVEREAAALLEDPDGLVRLDGADRYETSARVAEVVFPEATSVFLASGEDFPDALSGAPLAAVTGAGGSPLLLVHQDCAPTVVAEYSTDPRLTYRAILGGPGVLSSGVTDQCAP